MSARKLIVIGGQTGAGKSALAEKLAASLPLEVVSADSVQVYRGFNIGSAKPTRDERAVLPHHMIDILDPNDAIDAAEYARRADKAIAEIIDRGKVPLVVGGTGLWIRALLRGLVDLPSVDPELRSRLELEARLLGNRALHERLASVDPISAAQIHPNDTLRVVRALEVHTQTGEPLGRLRKKHALGGPRYTALMFVLEHPSQELRPRLLTRTHAMLHAGWIPEVENLLSKWPAAARAFGSVGYREVCSFLRGDFSLNELPTMIERETWRYAKRQRNWFRAEAYVDVRGPLNEVELIAKEQIEDFVS